jgi:hypothetical protein
MKKLFLTLVMASLFSSSLSAYAVTEDEQWPIPNEFSFGHHSVLIDDGDIQTSAFSVLTMYQGANSYLCKSLEDEKCKSAQVGNYRAFLPKCENATETDCIESLVAVKKSGVSLPGSLTAYTYDNKHPTSFSGDGNLAPLRGSDPSIWSIPGAPHAYGNEYVLLVSLSNAIDRSRDLSADAYFSMNLFPISRLATGYTIPDSYGFANYPRCFQKVDGSGNSYVACGGGAQEFSYYRCAAKMIEAATCLLRRAFPEDMRFKVSVRLKKEPASMLHGRLQDPAIEITKNAGSTKISVEAGSVRVPILYSGGQYNTLSQEVKDYWDKCLNSRTCEFFSRQASTNVITDPQRRNIQDYAESYGNRVLAIVPIFAKSVNDRAVAAPSAWNIKTLSRGQMQSSANCFKSGTGFVGVVTTNSTTYSEGPPTFVDGTLDYKVSSLHLLPNGDVFKGNYNLVLRSDVARCLYGFSNAPISATISVISADGQSQVATTVVNERKNWLYLSANGFTFSSPVIKVKLTQDGDAPAAIPSPTASPTAPKTSAKTQSITCQKGKVKKVVKGAKPACPKGFKKIA